MIAGSIYSTPISVRAYAPGHKVMILAANGVGDTYFPAKNKFESWGWSVTTAGLTSSVTSCPNTNPRPVPVNILISEVNNNTISEYECVFIPSGGHWLELLSDVENIDLISDAYNLGLILSSLWVGIRVLATANKVNGISIAYDINSASEVLAAGGIKVNQIVVSHRRIVTGGTGGGP